MRNGDSRVRPRDARWGTCPIIAAAFGDHANQQCRKFTLSLQSQEELTLYDLVQQMAFQDDRLLHKVRSNSTVVIITGIAFSRSRPRRRWSSHFESGTTVESDHLTVTIGEADDEQHSIRP